MNAVKLFAKEVSVLGTSLRGGFYAGTDGDGFVLVRFGGDTLTFSFGATNIIKVADADKPKVPPGVYNNVLLYGMDIAALDLEGVTIVGDLNLSNNQRLTSLRGCPSAVGRRLDCRNTGITSLEHGPRLVGGDYYCGSNVSMRWLPEKVGGTFIVTPAQGRPTQILRPLCKFHKMRCAETALIKQIGGVFREKLEYTRLGLKENVRL